MGPDRAARYAEIFTHLGFRGAELDFAVEVMTLFEAARRSGKKTGKVSERSHVRNGVARQWEAELEPAHLAYIEEHLGAVLRKFGYADAGDALDRRAAAAPYSAASNASSTLPGEPTKPPLPAVT
jgi:hypothetical protein